MVGGGKEANEVCSKGFSERLKEDRISQLPDPLICQILSHLPIKDSVKTSVLSSRWTSLWLWVPSLKLAYWDLRDSSVFRSLGDRFFDFNRVSCLDKLMLYIDDLDHDAASYLPLWIDAAVKRKIQHLDVHCSPDNWNEMPLSLYTCHTLVYLKLFGVILNDVEVVSLPCLKTMDLIFTCFGEEAVFERLVSCCPVLEKLKISGSVYGNINFFRVLSRSLKKLSIEIQHNKYQDLGLGFEIDAPRLRSLSINDNLSDDILMGMVDVSLPFGLDEINEASISLRSTSIPSFLPGISKLRDMTICKDIFKLICQYSEKKALPQFGYMSRLRVTLRVSDLIWLPTFLESCPVLKSLILVWKTNSKKMCSRELNQFNFSTVPECLLSSLEFVDIRTIISGHDAEHKLVRYFLENSTILKKLTLRLNYYCTDEKFIVKSLLEIPRRSDTCQVVIY